MSAAAQAPSFKVNLINFKKSIKYVSALCPASSTPFISALSLQPMQCTPNVDGACPGNFFCWFSTTTTAVVSI
jgi:hypothetical protein